MKPVNVFTGNWGIVENGILIVSGLRTELQMHGAGFTVRLAIQISQRESFRICMG